MDKVFVVTEGAYLGMTDVAYLHGVFTSEAKAKEAAKGIEDAEIHSVELDELQAQPVRLV